MDELEVTPGQRYYIVALIPGVWKVPREMVMTYLSLDKERGVLIMSARPLAGTQEFQASWIQKLVPTDRPILLPRKVR